jgi:hypothetical protein
MASTSDFAGSKNPILHFSILPSQSGAKMCRLKRLLPRPTVALLLLVSSHQLQAQQWYFEDTSPLITGTGSSLTGIAPEFGSGTASAFHASPLTVWSSPVGNGSPHSFSADHWAVGDYWQFQISSIGLAPDFITYDQTRSTTGPAQFKLSYSTDGVNFSSFPSYIVLTNSTSSNNSGTGHSTTPWSTSSYQTIFTLTNFPGSITSIQNAETVYFRVVCDSDPSSAAGTSRLDNFYIFSHAIPEPSAVSLFAASCLLVRCLRARRR